MGLCILRERRAHGLGGDVRQAQAGNLRLIAANEGAGDPIEIVPVCGESEGLRVPRSAKNSSNHAGRGTADAAALSRW